MLFWQLLALSNLVKGRLVASSKYSRTQVYADGRAVFFLTYGPAQVYGPSVLSRGMITLALLEILPNYACVGTHITSIQKGQSAVPVEHRFTHRLPGE